jgi:hypothetical protein
MLERKEQKLIFVPFLMKPIYYLLSILISQLPLAVEKEQFKKCLEFLFIYMILGLNISDK